MTLVSHPLDELLGCIEQNQAVVDRHFCRSSAIRCLASAVVVAVEHSGMVCAPPCDISCALVACTEYIWTPADLAPKSDPGRTRKTLATKVRQEIICESHCFHILNITRVSYEILRIRKQANLIGRSNYCLGLLV